MRQKIIGWVLMILAGILAFGTLGTLGSLLHSLGTFFLGLLGKATIDDTAKAFGGLVAQTAIFVIMYFAWTYGRKWTRKAAAPIESNNPEL